MTLPCPVSYKHLPHDYCDGRPTLSYTTRTTCRCCGSKDLVPLFSLGEQYVSNFVDNPTTANDGKVPLDFELCRSCMLVQAKHTAPQDLLYSKHYWYRSGVTQTMRDALKDVTAAAEKLVDLSKGDIVLDIGSNDGTLLRSYTHPWIVRVGCEPADNLATEENYGGVRCGELIHDFWSYKAYRDCVEVIDWEPCNSWKAKVITACGMFYDLEDPNQFIADVAKVLAPDGLFIAQLTCLKNMLDLNDVGNLCHEHLEFYSLRSLQQLLGMHGLKIYDIETNGVNGHSYRLYIKRHVHTRPEKERLRVIAAFDAEEGLDNFNFYKGWFDAINAEKAKCISFIKEAVAAGKRVWVYGASTKGNVILQWYGLDGKLIDAAADRSPEKWDKFTVGTNIPITSEEHFRVCQPDYALVLPYAFLPEFMKREKEWRDKGGKFLVPLPFFKVV